MRRAEMHVLSRRLAHGVLKGTAGANDGSRTRDIQDHNLALYQLSYVRHNRRGVYGDQPAAVNRAVPVRAWKCRASRVTASSSRASCLQKAKRA
jgi:hypothetical protein